MELKIRNIKSKKGQLKIQEMIFMLLGVVLFFILVGLFALTLLYSNVQKEARIIAETKTLSSITNLADSPEFACVGKSNCVDFDKALALSTNKNYQNFWPFSSLAVLKINPQNNSIVDCNLANYPNCDKLVVYDKNVKQEKVIASFVAICRTENEEGIYEKCELGKFLAGVELK